METKCFQFLVFFKKKINTYFVCLIRWPHNCQCASGLNCLLSYICTWEPNWVIRSLDQSAAGDSPSP